jgi:hypothetical protein
MEPLLKKLSSITIQTLFAKSMGDNDRITVLLNVLEDMIDNESKTAILMDAMAQVSPDSFTTLLRHWKYLRPEDRVLVWLFEASFRHGTNTEFTRVLLRDMKIHKLSDMYKVQIFTEAVKNGVSGDVMPLLELSTMSDMYKVQIFTEAVKNRVSGDVMPLLELSTVIDMYKVQLVKANMHNTEALQKQLIDCIKLSTVDSMYRANIMKLSHSVELFKYCYDRMGPDTFNDFYLTDVY